MMEKSESNNKSVTMQIVDEFINSLTENEEFDEVMLEELSALAMKKQLSNENSIEKIINPEIIPK